MPVQRSMIIPSLGCATLILALGCAQESTSTSEDMPSTPSQAPVGDGPNPDHIDPTPVIPPTQLPAPEPPVVEPTDPIPPGMQSLKASNAAPGDQFGMAVAIDGDRVAIGATGVSIGENGGGSGGVYIFERDDRGEWIETAVFASVTTDRSDAFGAAVALSGDRLAVGSPEKGHWRTPEHLMPQGNVHSIGAVHLFERQPDGEWLETALITSDDRDYGRYFGSSVALEDDRLVVGEPGDLRTEAPSTISWEGIGQAHVFDRSPDGEWLHMARFEGDDDGDGAHFGADVAFDGDHVFVGAPFEGESGAVYVFEDEGDEWARVARLVPNDAAVGAFGAHLAAEAGRLVVGAYSVYASGIEGKVFVFDQMADDTWSAERADVYVVDARFASAVALAGDRLLVGSATGRERGRPGSASIFERGPDSEWPRTARIVPPNADPYDFVGAAVALGDGIAVIGAPGDDGGPESTLTAPDDDVNFAGAVYVVELP